MSAWVLIIILILSVAVIIYVIKSIMARTADASSKISIDYSNKKQPKQTTYTAPETKKLKSVDVLPSVEAIKAKKEFNWQKLHQTINPEKNKAIETKLTKLIREEREYIIVDKFIYHAKLNPNDEIIQILDEVEKNSKSYQEISRSLGNR